jgi:hypothetical protein
MYRRVSLQEQGWSENLEDGRYLSRNRVKVKTYRRISLQEQGWNENLEDGISPGTGLE